MDSNKPSTTKVFVVHGVGPFNQKGIIDEIKKEFGEYGLTDIAPFNWDQEVARVFAPKSFAMNVGVLSEVSQGLVNAANLGFLDNRSYAGLRRWVIHIQNIAMLAAQVFGWALLLLVLPKPLLPDAVWRVLHGSLFVVSITVMLGALTAWSTRSLVACGRRLILTFVWPFVHFLAVPLGFGLVYLFVQLALFPMTMFFINEWDDRFGRPSHVWSMPMIGISYMAASLAIIGAGFALARAVHLMVALPLKAVADVFRYIGVPLYSSRLQEGFVTEFRRVAQGCNHMVLLTHSLGSVIAVDALRANPDLTANLQRLDLVTMGSPLKRFFSTLFPGIFLKPEFLCHELNARIPNFHWVNIYRRLDYIGARLSRDSNSPIKECPMPTSLKSHTGYWSDPVVVSTIITAIKEFELVSSNGRQVASGAAPFGDVYSPAMQYPDRLAWFWDHRTVPLKLLIAAGLLGIYARILLELLRSALAPKSTPFSLASMSELEWYLQVWFYLMISFALWFIARTGRKFFTLYAVPYCNSLYGRLAAPPIPWGIPPVTPPVPAKSTWNRPGIVIPIAILLLVGDTVAAIVSGAQWIPVIPRMELHIDVRSIAFKDRDHLILAGGDGIYELSLDRPDIFKPLPFEGSLGRRPIVQLSPNGNNIAWIENVHFADPNKPSCVVAATLSSGGEVSVTDRFFQRCTTEPTMKPVDVAVSNDNQVAVRHDAGSYNGTTVVLYSKDSATTVATHRESWPSTGSLRFDPTSKYLAWKADTQAQLYVAPGWKPQSSVLTLKQKIAAIFVATPNLFVVAMSDSTPEVAVVRPDATEVGTHDVAELSGDDEPVSVALSEEGQRLALAHNIALYVWDWQRHNYWTSAKEVFYRMFAVDAWKTLHDYLYGDQSTSKASYSR